MLGAAVAFIVAKCDVWPRAPTENLVIVIAREARMKSFSFGRSKVSQAGPCYVIAEIGHNHQGSVEICKKLFDAAAQYGTNCVKLQKRDNRSLYTKAYYDRP